MWLSISLSIGQNCGDFKTFQIVKILISRIILRKLQNFKKNSWNKKILRIRMLVNTAPGLVGWCRTSSDNWEVNDGIFAIHSVYSYPKVRG